MSVLKTFEQLVDIQNFLISNGIDILFLTAVGVQLITFCMHLLAIYGLAHRNVCVNVMVGSTIVSSLLGVAKQSLATLQIVDTSIGLFIGSTIVLVIWGNFHRYCSQVMLFSTATSYFIMALNVLWDGYIYHTPGGCLSIFMGTYILYSNIDDVEKKLNRVLNRFPEIWFVEPLIPKSKESKELSLRLHLVALVNLYYLMPMVSLELVFLIHMMALLHMLVIVQMTRYVDSNFLISTYIEVFRTTLRICEQIRLNYNPQNYFTFTKLASLFLYVFLIFTPGTAYSAPDTNGGINEAGPVAEGKPYSQFSYNILGGIKQGIKNHIQKTYNREAVENGY